ncbi:MAG: hypothetical protein K2V38_29010, partial [Gemmataceae bacterium]|nr:hypothetical protein [Gemmataceae bacterium]
AKRLRALGLDSVGQYVRLLDGRPAGDPERQEFVNCLTTNKTDFFRESHHFDHLRQTFLPQLRAAGRKRVRVWSAGCSTGEEPYTLAMVLGDECPGWDVKILASDIDTDVLAAAERGVYDADRARGVPGDLLRRHFLRGTGANAGKVTVRPELRELIAFRQINFMAPEWPMRTRFDAIFCRNVMIYFDRDTQRRLLTRFADLLEPGGLVFLGHSESLHWLADRFAAVGNTIYQPRDGCAPTAAPVAPVATPAPVGRLYPRPPAPKPPAEPEYSIILGDVQATKGPAVIKTLLGSCVAACLYDPDTGIGGMNHFCLPGESDEGTSARYGAHAMELLITAIMKKGGDRGRLRAKVFGGAKVLNLGAKRLNVGAKNAAFVLQFLADEGIPVDARCLGGDRGLLVRFRPHTGQAQAKPLGGTDLSPVVARERAFGRELQHQVDNRSDTGITLF